MSSPGSICTAHFPPRRRAASASARLYYGGGGHPGRLPACLPDRSLLYRASRAATDVGADGIGGDADVHIIIVDLRRRADQPSEHGFFRGPGASIPTIARYSSLAKNPACTRIGACAARCR